MDNCSICIEKIKDEFFLTECGHSFHLKCIKAWFERSTVCPLCRKKIGSWDVCKCDISDLHVIEFLGEPVVSTVRRIRIVGGQIEEMTEEFPDYGCEFSMNGSELAEVVDDIGSVDMDRLMLWLTRRDLRI